MRHLLLLITLLVISFSVFSQTLKTSGAISLSSGGRVYDMEYIPGMDAYVLVGNFTSVNGTPRENIALIDATTNNILPNTSFTPSALDFDGIVRAVEYMNSGNKHYIVLGGDFFTINFDGTSNTYYQGMAVIEATTGVLSSSTNFSLVGWDYATVNGNGYPGSGTSGNGVYDLETSGDTLYVAGKVIGVDVAVGENDHYCDNPPADIWNTTFYALKVNNGVGSRFDKIQASINTPLISNNFVEGTFGIEKLANGIAIAATPSTNMQHRDNNFVVDPNLTVEESTATTDYFASPVLLNDTVLCFVDNSGGTGGERLGAYATNSYPNNTPGPVSNWGMQAGLSFYWSQVHGHTSYNEDLIVFRSFTSVDPLGERNVIKRYKMQGIASPGILDFVSTGTEQVVLPNVGGTIDFAKDTTNNFFRFGNKLFFSYSGITNVEGQVRNGIAEFCLEPKNPEAFTAFDTVMCENAVGVYTIPQAESAEGYRWSYSGIGAEYLNSGSWLPLVNEIIPDVNANSVQVRFNTGATSGTISVEPFATCNTAVDYLFAESQTGNITVVPAPNISMADSTFLNCYSDSAWILVSTTTVLDSFSIHYNGNTVINDSLLIQATDPSIFQGYYFGMVTEPINGCSAYDSTYFSFDLTPPTFNSAAITTTPAFFSCGTDSMVISANVPGSNIVWTYDPDPTTPLPNSFTIYSDDSLNFTATAQQLSNGCIANQPFQVQLDYSVATPLLVGHPNFITEIIDDSLNCSTPTLTLECGATAGTASWLNGTTPTGSTLLTLTTADSLGMVNNLKTYRFVTEDGVSGCTDTTEIIMLFDFEKPFVVTHPQGESINCSEVSIEVIHQTSGNSVEGWLNEFGVQTGNDTLIANTVGDYYYQVEGNNGCLNTDTVTISQTMDIDIQLPLDTLICPNQSVSITATPILNTGETPTFLWSNGDTSNSASATGGIDAELSVIVQTISGCIGYDAVSISITPPVVAEISSASGCNGAVIQIDNVTGGSGGYEFSLDQTNWQTSTAFTDLTIGTYNLFIRDDLGCVYDFTETIIPGEGEIDIDFLVPAYNELLDTAVCVNFQSFDGFDSLEWIVPGIADIAFESDSILAFSIDTEGWYDITFIGFLDTCQYSQTKTIYFGQKPIYSDSTEQLGINDVIVYPNPTNGTFTLEVSFGAIQNYTVLVSSSSGQPIASMTASGTSNTIQQDFTFPVGTTPGAYVIHIVADYDADHRTIILD